MLRTPLLVSLLSLPLAACSQPSDTEDTAPGADTLPAERSGASPQGEPLVPETIALAEWREADLTGELGCSFNRNDREDPLLLAAADVADDAPAEAAVKVGGSIEKLTMDRRGGFSALSEGGRFTGEADLTADVAVTGDTPLEEDPAIAMESPRYAATLTFTRAGQSVATDGFWECGP